MNDRAPQAVDRQLPTEEARDLISLVREMVRRDIAPATAEEEEAGRFPRETFTRLSESGLLGLPYPVEYGGGDQPYEVYLQVLEELAAARLTVGLGVSVHTLACHALAAFGTDEQRAAHLPAMTAGGLLGAYGLSASRRLRRGLAAHPGPPRWGRLGDRRLQGMDHPRRDRRLLHRDGPHR